MTFILVSCMRNEGVFVLACGLTSSVFATMLYLWKGSNLTGGLTGMLLLSFWLIPLIVGYVVLSENHSKKNNNEGKRQSDTPRWVLWATRLFFCYLMLRVLDGLIAAYFDWPSQLPTWYFRPIEAIFETVAKADLVYEALLFIALSMSAPLVVRSGLLFWRRR